MLSCGKASEIPASKRQPSPKAAARLAQAPMEEPMEEAMAAPLAAALEAAMEETPERADSETSPGPILHVLHVNQIF